MTLHKYMTQKTVLSMLCCLAYNCATLETDTNKRGVLYAGKYDRFKLGKLLAKSSTRPQVIGNSNRATTGTKQHGQWAAKLGQEEAGALEPNPRRCAIVYI